MNLQMTQYDAFSLILIPVAYLIGSIPFGIFAARVFGGVDPRSGGSRNIGATNVGRTAGKAAGVATLLLDFLKGALPTLLAQRLNPAAAYVSMVAFAAFAGHLFPIFLKFKGGKGVATAFGAMLSACPAATLLSAAVFVVVVLWKRYVSLGSIIAAALLPLFLSLLSSSRHTLIMKLNPNADLSGPIAPSGKDFLILGVLVAVFVILKHKENIKRIVAGTENRI